MHRGVNSLCRCVTLPSASRFLHLAGKVKPAVQAEIALIQQAYEWHNWQKVIDLGRRFHERHGRVCVEVQIWMIESLRMISGTLYQLGEHRRALEHFAALAHETSQVNDASLLANSWTAKPDAQFRINLEDPKSAWVSIAEHYELNWTHPTGRADGSNYAGEVPLDLSARRVTWRTGKTVSVQPP